MVANKDKMMIITDITLPTQEQLQPLLIEALSETSEEAFIQSHVNGITETLKTSPLSYRHYGPYWWSIKALLREHDVDFGEEAEEVTASHFNYENKVHLLCAAWSYSRYIVGSGQLYTLTHDFPTDEDQPYEYSIEDLDMESLALTDA